MTSFKQTHIFLDPTKPEQAIFTIQDYFTHPPEKYLSAIFYLPSKTFANMLKSHGCIPLSDHTWLHIRDLHSYHAQFMHLIFFQDYCQVLNEKRPKKMASFYHRPCTIADRMGSVIFRQSEELYINFLTLIQSPNFHEDIVFKILKSTSHGPQAISYDLLWYSKDQNEPVSAVRYLLTAPEESSWKIACTLCLELPQL